MARKEPLTRALSTRRHFPAVSLLLFLLLLAACLPEESPDGLPTDNPKSFKTMDFSKKVVVKAITSILKERGFSEPTADIDSGNVETSYITEGDYRTKVEAKVKELTRGSCEVSLLIITEKKAKGAWLPTKMVDRSQYERFFGEVELQSYREMAKIE
ncbi:MAG TPA: hypothetical protein VLS90_06905 [Thermodesulfobacteriota bacterium]|nr:hypothetical protein [Thermodesulfobacteriota bacterium]